MLGRWEHTPEWSYTSKLLISKHQQVQLLEAASVLVAMNGKDSGTTPPDSTKDFASEADSASPAASGYSEQHDSHSSADTTPPPLHAESLLSTSSLAYRGAPKRYSSGSGYSQSFQSVTSGSFFPGSIPSATGFGHHRHGSSDIRRPPSSGKSNTGQEDRDLAAAVELLSCSFGSNGTSKDTRLPEDAPPVPPLPAQYLDQAAFGTSFINGYQARQMPESFTRGESLQPRSVKREESEDSIMGDDDDDHHRRYRARGSDDDDEMMFGRMED